MSDDRKLIEKHGGPARLAALLGYTVQRVHNWIVRGIPYKVKVENPKLFRK